MSHSKLQWMTLFPMGVIFRNRSLSERESEIQNDVAIHSQSNQNKFTVSLLFSKKAMIYNFIRGENNGMLQCIWNGTIQCIPD